MPTDSSDRRIIKIAISPAAKDAIEKFSERYDMKEFAVASRFYEWFAAQDDIYQRAVMGMLHGLEVDAAKAFMYRWAAAAKYDIGLDDPSSLVQHTESNAGAGGPEKEKEKPAKPPEKSKPRDRKAELHR